MLTTPGTLAADVIPWIKSFANKEENIEVPLSPLTATLTPSEMVRRAGVYVHLKPALKFSARSDLGRKWTKKGLTGSDFFAFSAALLSLGVSLSLVAFCAFNSASNSVLNFPFPHFRLRHSSRTPAACQWPW